MNKTFGKLLWASSVSMLGSHITTIAYPLLVLRLTGSPFMAGCAAFAATAPSIIVQIPAGALIDRWEPRRTMLLSEFGRGVAIGIIAVTLALGKATVALLIIAAVVEGVLEVFSGLAERRYVGSLVDREQVPSALVRIEARTHVVLLAGRPLGGLLFEIKPIYPYIADALTFLYSVAMLFSIKDDKAHQEAAKKPRQPISMGNLVYDMKEGLRWIHKDRFSRVVIVSFSIGTLLFQALIMVFLADAHSQDFSALDIGAILGASGVGGTLGSAVASRLLTKVHNSWTQSQSLVRIQAAIWVGGFTLLVFLGGRQVIFTAIIMAILGFSGAVGNIVLDTYLLCNSDKEMLARVTSVSRMASFAACAIGPVFGGLLVQKLGVRPAMLWLFLTTPALLALAVLTPSVPSPRRSLDSSEEADPAPRRSQPDTHVHFTFPDRDLEWSTETRQAAIGGVTMPLIYFRDPAPYGDSLAQFIATGQRSAHTDFVVHLGILNNGHLDQFDEVLDRFAIRSIKMYTTCKDGSLRRFGILDQDDGFILDVMRRVAARGDTVVNVHCANDDIVRRGQAHWAQHVQGQAEQWAAMRPPSTELEAIRRICLLARETGTRPHLPRVSSRRAIDIAIAERALRTEVSIETCPQHLKLKLAAASGALSNTLDVAAGLPGSGTLVPLMMDSAHRSLITTSDPVRANLRPATMPGLEHRGQIQPGYHAAMTILWPDRERRAGPGVGSPGGAAERIMPDEQRA